ncbi:MAG: universal stress protein [Candidatus Methylacidiphilales bacterium]
MISKILIPTDFSEVANNALQYAIHLAQKVNAELHVFHIKNIPLVDTSYPNTIYQTYMVEIDEFATKNFEKLETNVLIPSGLSFKTQSAYGFINDEIQEYTKTNQIDLIILGTTGASGIQEILIGSNAASVVAKSEIPVLIIPPMAKFEEILHLVYATDFNEPEFPAVSRLAYFSGLYNAEISILHVKSEYDDYFDKEHNFFVKNKDQIALNNWKIVNVTEKENIIESINSYVEANRTNLLVMAKHNRNFFDKLFHRSLSKQMAFHTKIPLLVLNK